MNLFVKQDRFESVNVASVKFFCKIGRSHQNLRQI